jgi:hypothetical protein
MVAIGSLNLNFRIFGRSWLNWRPDGALRWKVKTVGWEGRKWYVESRHLQGYSPRLCRLRTDGLAHASKYWTYQSHAGVYGVLLLRAVDLFKSIDVCAKGCYALTMWDTYGLGPYVNWVWKACGVLVWFSPAWCISIQIAMTFIYEEPLVCGSQHVAT